MIRCQITDGTAHLNEEDWFAGLAPDVEFLQVREKGLSARDLGRVVRRALAVGPRILVNDRTDVAVATGAAGVHLRGDSIRPSELRKIVPAGFVITVACHSEADCLECAGADYAILSPVFSPLSKQDTRPALGLDTLRRIVRVSPVPVIALGGITGGTAAECIAAGAVGVAGITLFRR